MSDELAAFAGHPFPGRTIGCRVLYFARTSSTMDRAREAARLEAEEGTILLADEQTAGRGRLQRTWVAPPGSSILFSVLLRPSLAMLPRLTVMASLAVAAAVEDCGAGPARIKWPNDVLIGGRKVAGILLESELRGASVAFAIAGIGVNVNLDASALADLAVPATSLSSALGRDLPRGEVFRALVASLDAHYRRLRDGEALHEAWRARLVTLGQPVTATIGNLVEEGTAEDVDADGSLILRRPDGSRVTIVAGDVTLRRTETRELRTE
jgi:BirA family biotin operon repressor/biotin-[acetyl-CoA-carboxylase] ligase